MPLSETSEPSGQSDPSNTSQDAPRPWLARRLVLYQAAERHPELQAVLVAWCKRDVRFWFRHFCWTFDPRKEQPHLPFVP